MPDLTNLFVYGTLRAAAGTEWSRFLTAASRFVGSGRARGVLFQLGGYPGMTVCAGEDEWVRGEVYLLNDPTATLASLDAYEGCSHNDPMPHEFERQAVNVVLDGGQTVEAWAYVYTLETQGRPRVESGDYLQPKPEWPTCGPFPS